MRRLHIGGEEHKEGWEIFNANPNFQPNHLGDATDLSRFPDETFNEVYASHILEHFSYNKQILNTLSEWYRVLKPKGKIYVSVPDLERLCYLFLSENLSNEEKFFVMRMIYGGQGDEYDFHKVGIWENLLEDYLSHVGFTNIERVENFGIFKDASNLNIGGIPISINMIGIKENCQYKI